jgi:hypothetical protein
VLRLAHRLDLTPQRIAELTGLAKAGCATPAVHMLDLDDAAQQSFARATKLTSREVAGLLLVDLADRYPPLTRTLNGQPRQLRGILQQESWLFGTSTRCCPDCLAGNDSIIQQRHGGPWKKHWRLPTVFACTQHHRLLEHRCPACREPILTLAGERLLPQMAISDLHPAQCRATVRDPTTRHGRLTCGAELNSAPEQPAAGPVKPLGRLLELQDRILDLLHPNGPAITHCLGHQVAATSYLTDLRITAGLISASWPVALDVTDHPPLVSALDSYLRQRHHDIAERRRHKSRPPESTLHDQPPLRADACAALLALADHLITQVDPDTGGQAVAVLAAQASLGPAWARRVTTFDTHRASPALTSALHPILSQWIKAPGRRVVRYLPGPTRPANFDHRHVPQRLPDGWYQRHFGHLTGANPMLLNRLGAINLVRLVEGGSLPGAARLLGNPDGRAWSTIARLRSWFQQRAHAAAFSAALDALADELDAATDLVNYGQRRDALADWSIPPDEWHALTADLISAEAPRGPQFPPTDWGGHKRRLVSIIVWTHLTQSEFRIAPSLPAHPATIRHDLQQHWHRFQSQRPYRHHIHLKARLANYMNDLAHRIDNSRD